MIEKFTPEEIDRLRKEISEYDKRPFYFPFESAVNHGRFTKISDNMYYSAAYQDLSMRQRQLYFQMKQQFYPKLVVHGVTIEANDKNIIYPRSLWIKDYSSWRTFHKDLEALKSHGFIEELRNGKESRTKNIYSFSEGWKCWRKKDDLR